jgi:leucyl aminopeptidase
MAKKKNNISHEIVCIESAKGLSALTLSKSEIAYAKTKLKKNLDWIYIPQLSNGIYVVIVSKSQDFKTKEKLRGIGDSICGELNKNKVEQVLIKSASKNNSAIYLIEGLALSNYQFLKYFTDKKEKANSLQNIFVQDDNISAAKIDEMWAVVDATFKARDLVNEPLSFLNAEQIAAEFELMGAESGFSVKVLNHSKIQTLKMGGLLAVNQGSIDPATFSIMEWKPDNAKNSRPIVLVGKGVVYDTGGLSLKPTANSMDMMKCDMGGAAAVGGAIYAIAKNKLPVHVIALVPATDNRPGGNAYAPGDVVTMYSGKTVEVLNTDAEGRMILADALHYAKKYKPEIVLDFATLTGAAVRAIGDHASVVMGTASDDDFTQLDAAGNETYERIVEFPFFEEYGDEIKSSIADIKNLGGATAGAITAGKFLEHFTDYPWIHVDIAGPAWRTGKRSYLPVGGTGIGVRLLYEFVKNRY